MKVIYSIINKINGHQYIGSAKNYYKRKSLHLRQLKNNKHHSKYLQNAWNKYGEENFTFLILEKIEKDLILREQWWIDNSHCEYNMCKIAGSSLGLKRSEESKEKMRQAHLGKVHPQWRKDLKSISQGGTKHWNYGKKLSKETIKKKSNSMKEYYKTNEHHNKGKSISVAQIEKLQKANFISVSQYSKDDIFIKNFESIVSAAKELNIHTANIVACCKNKIKTSGGFKWKYNG
jgi:group I intron endonuclease